MWTWITGLSGIDAVFFGCAVLGGGLFLIRLVLLVFGLGDHHDFGPDVGGLDADGIDAHGFDHDTEMGAGMLSITGLTGFFMMFGVVGTAMRLEEHASAGLSVGVAFGAGLFAMWAAAQVVRQMMKLRASGNIDPGNAVGVDGRVYLTIPSGGRGQVEVAVQGRMRIFDAKGEHPGELKTGTHVRVVRVIEGDTLIVEKAS